MNKSKYSIDFGSLKKKMAEKNNKKKSFNDERFYYPQRNENGVAKAVIRFLPQKFVDGKPTTDLPYVECFKHIFKHNGKFFIKNCPDTIGEKCPVCEDVKELYNDDSTKNIAGQRYKKTEFVTNILVVNDPQNPENNGKVFLHKFGKKIKDKIFDKMGLGNEEDEVSLTEPVNVFDYFDGANFILKIKRTAKDNKGKQYPDYSTSEWMPSEPIVKSDEEADKLNNKLYDLSEFYDPSRFESYEKLEKRYEDIVGTMSSKSTSEATNVEEKDSDLSFDSDDSDVDSSVSIDDDDDDDGDIDGFLERLEKDSDVD